MNLTERSANAATIKRRKFPTFYNEEVIGFGLQVRDKGRKTFTFSPRRLSDAGPPCPRRPLATGRHLKSFTPADLTKIPRNNR